jgi:hypothetical protein
VILLRLLCYVHAVIVIFNSLDRLKLHMNERHK